MRRSGRNRNQTVTVTRTIEIDVEIECAVSPGEPAHGPTYDCGGYPGSDPEVEILEVTLDYGGHVVRLPDDVLTKADIEAIEEAALEAATDAAIAGAEDAAEAAAEARADRRREEGW